MELGSDGDEDIVIRKGITTTTIFNPRSNNSNNNGGSSAPTARSLKDLQANTAEDSAAGSWRFSQCFGDKSEDTEISDGDIISAVEFDGTGEFLASGDRAGRIVMFQRNHTKKRGCEYKFYTEFQSHEAEFDYLKSLEINERINSIAWTRQSQGSLFLLSTNDKTVKLWKVKERQVEAVIENNQTSSTAKHPALPRTIKKEPVIAAIPKRIFANAHAYHIHSISACSDAETFISSDDLRVNLWHLHASDSFCLVDLKPGSIEELTEVITCCTFHPRMCNLFAFSTSKGSVRLGDMRSSALCDRSSAVLCSTNGNTAAASLSTSSSSNFFTEIIQSISDCKFSPVDDNCIAARDYLSVRLWDIRRPSAPTAILPVHDHIRPRLCDLYENDCIFDRFRLSWAPTGRQLISGSYGDRVRALDIDPKTVVGTGWAEDVVADRSVFRLAAASGNALAAKGKGLRRLVGRRVRSAGGSDCELLSSDYARKVLNVAVHPSECSMAVAATSNLFIFTQL